jgi:hypothetical protein
MPEPQPLAAALKQALPPIRTEAEAQAAAANLAGFFQTILEIASERDPKPQLKGQRRCG